MGDIQHANAKTTLRIRKEIQESNETIAELAARLSLNPKTVTKFSLDDVFIALKDETPKMTRSNLHRCLHSPFPC